MYHSSQKSVDISYEFSFASFVLVTVDIAISH